MSKGGAARTVGAVKVAGRSIQRVASCALLGMVLSACSLFTSVPTSLEPVPDAAPDRRAAQAAQRPQRPSLAWRGCGESFECADLRVPIDHTRPGGRSVALALIRLPAPAKADRLG